MSEPCNPTCPSESEKLKERNAIIAGLVNLLGRSQATVLPDRDAIVDCIYQHSGSVMVIVK